MTAGRHINTLSQEWCTPQKYVDAIYDFYNGVVDLDPCSNEFSIINANTEYIYPEKDGLIESWDFQHIYVNPPYGRSKSNKTTIKNWIKKCNEAYEIHNSEVLALIPVATNTRHWKDYIFYKASSICFLYDTRLKFRINGNEDDKGCPMACALIYWGNNSNKFREIFGRYGAIIDTKEQIQ